MPLAKVALKSRVRPEPKVALVPRRAPSIVAEPPPTVTLPPGFQMWVFQPAGMELPSNSVPSGSGFPSGLTQASSVEEKRGAGIPLT